MSQESRKISCIVCPLGCSGTVEIRDGQIHSLTGFTCDRGKQYAREELTAPKRVLTTTVKVTGGRLKLLPVVSQRPLPKDKILACARCLAGTVVKAPVEEGQVVCANILGLGVDIIAARNLPAE